MPTKEELEQENQELKAKLIEAEENRPKGLAGWIVKAQNNNYSGKTAGVQFRAGQAFVSDVDDEAQNRVKALCGDFGYTAEYIEDFFSAPETEQMTGSMIDMLQTPQVGIG